MMARIEVGPSWRSDASKLTDAAFAVKYRHLAVVHGYTTIRSCDHIPGSGF